MKLSHIYILAILFPANAVCMPDHVRVSLFSIFRPLAVIIKTTDQNKLIVRTTSEDGRQTDYHASKFEIECAGKAPVCWKSGELRVCGESIEVRHPENKNLDLGVPQRNVLREYLGWFEVKESNRQCLIINHVPLENYVADVACKELDFSGPQALKAQAIAVRSYTYSNIGKHAAAGYDFCDLTHCQAYVGQKACNLHQRNILKSVEGLVLSYEGKPADAYYFSTCAGHTAAAKEIWGSKSEQPYLQGVDEGDPPCCSHSPHMHWRFRVQKTKLCFNLGQSLKINSQDCQVEILKYGTGGWVEKIAVKSSESITLSGEKFHMLMGKAFGWGKFKSSKFVIREYGDQLEFVGRGLGHGVGMCQYGAMGMEKAGKDFKEILEHYYPQTSLEKIK
jgi:stage II sporulation protein D